jgi:2-phosphosulfolactate phosphatase
MRIDVYFTPMQISPSAVSGKVVAMIDVLRASTCIAVALANGAKNVLPFDSADEAITRAKSFDKSEVVLAGERKMLPISGFEIGNSPLEYTPEVVEGRSILLTTTNGTAALTSVQSGGAREIVIASYVNFTAVAALLRTAVRAGTDVVLLCGGRERAFALEDAACAGRYVRYIMQGRSAPEMSDAAQAAMLLDRRYGDRVARLFADSEHGRALAEAGFAQDLEACAAIDSYPVIPVYQERQITKIGPERER